MSRCGAGAPDALVPTGTLGGGGACLQRMPATTLRVPGETLRAGADGAVACHVAECIGSTGVGRVARIGALVVDAGQTARAVGAGAAAEDADDALANFLAVAVVISPAQRLTDSVVTNFIDQAGLVVEADILAELAIADLPLRALGVGRA